MATISTAVGSERQAIVNGLNFEKGVFSALGSNLAQKIVILGEANTANQAGLSTDPVTGISTAEAGRLFGYGCPIHSMMRILKPISGDGVGGIPIIICPQISSGSATATVREWAIAGTASASSTLNVIVNGRTGIDFKKYDVAIAKADTATVIATKIINAINGVTSAPCTANGAAHVVSFTSKWKGATSSELTIEFSSSTDVGISYTQTASTNGSGVVDISASLASFGDDWNTIVLNPYGEVVFDVLEEFNGVADGINSTGRYSGLVKKPFVAFFGENIKSKTSLLAITNHADRVSQMTNALCPAPGSKNFKWEIAASYAYRMAVTAQNSPHLDVAYMTLPDIIAPANGGIGDMNDYDNRDLLVKGGCSTVILKNGEYVIQDFVTTYHPEGEVVPHFNYVRNLMVQWNLSHRFQEKEEINLKGKTIIADDQTVSVSGVVKTSDWKAIVYAYHDEVADLGLLLDPDFSKENTQIAVGTVNHNRFDTRFPVKITGTVRISSTTMVLGF